MCNLSYTPRVDEAMGYTLKVLEVETFLELRLDLHSKIVEVSKFISDTVETKLFVVVSVRLSKNLFKL